MSWAPHQAESTTGAAPSCSPALTVPRQFGEAQPAAGEGLTLEPSQTIATGLTPRMLLSSYLREMITSYKKLMKLQDESMLSCCSPDVPILSPGE